MIREALDRLIGLGQEAHKPQPIDVGDPHVKAYVIGGQTEVFKAAVPNRGHKVDTLEGFIELVNRFPKASAWYNLSSILAVLDDEVRRDTARLDLRTSDKWTSVSTLPSRGWMDHKEFCRFLRVELAGVITPFQLLEKIRKVKFENQAAVSSEVRRDRESMGKEIASKTAVEEGEIPEDVVLVTPIFTTPGLEELDYSLECWVEVDAQRGQFRLVPKADEIERVTQLALDAVGEILRERLTSSLVYQGRP